MMAFDPDAYLASKASPGGFDPDAYLTKKAAPTAPPVTKLESAARGGLQGLSAGFSDEVEGGADAVMQKIADWIAENKGGDSLKDNYQSYRDKARAENEAARAANPKVYGGSEVAGMVGSNFIPGMSAATIPKMAALGALQGAGFSTADLTEGDVGGAVRDTGIGAGAGAVGGAAAKGVGALLEKLLSPEALANFARERGAKALGYTKRFLNTPEKFAKSRDVAQTMLDEGVITPFAGAEEMAGKVADLKNTAGSEIGKFLKGAAGLGLDPEKAIAEIESLRPQFFGGDYTAVHKALDTAIETIRAHGRGPIPWEEANKLKGILQDAGKFGVNSDTLTTGARRMAAGKFRGALDTSLEDAARNPMLLATEDLAGAPGELAGPGRAVRGLSPDESTARFEQFLKNKKVYGAANEAEDALANRLSSEQGNKTIGLTDVIAAGSEVASGSPASAGLLLGAKRGAERYGNQATAVAADKAAKATGWVADKIPDMLKMNPQIFGKYAPLLERAAAGGAQELSVRHFLLMSSDPEYNALIHSAEENGGQTQ